jgi:signal peptidase
MEPAFHRGDLLFLINPPNARYEIGDITVYKIPGQDIPIVHRILETHDVVKAVNGSVSIGVALWVIPSLLSSSLQRS